MNRAVICMTVILSLLLTGCGGAGAELPADWEADWTVVSPLLAVEPFGDFTLNESNDALYASGIYYATWVTGQARPHTNEDGEAAEIFDGQIYVLVQEFRSAEAAQTNAAQWIAREKQSFETGEEAAAALAGQEFTILPLLSGSDQNPYSYGVAAFAVRGNWAICVELLLAQGQTEPAGSILEAFLSGFHYSE